MLHWKCTTGLVSSLALACLGSGCSLNALGHEEDVTQSHDVQSLSQIEDDRIADKNPVFDPTRTITEAFGSSWPCTITLNKSATVTKLDVVPFDGFESALDGKLFRGRREALASIGTIADQDAIPSMEVVNGYLKPFNDGLYAAVELQEEADKHGVLVTLLARLGDLLSAADVGTRPALEDAAVMVAAALILGGDTPSLDAALQSRAQARVATFNAEPIYARPIGFYTWTPALQRIFTRDRFLQNNDDSESFGAFAALAWVLGQDATLLATYQQVAALYAGLTNPYLRYTIDALIPYVSGLAALSDTKAIETEFRATHPLLTPCVGALVAFLPASRSKEVEYFDSRFCSTGVPAGTNLLDLLVQAIKNGAVDLAPSADAGWYDYQLYALETLLVPERGPESQHLLLTAGYKKKLIETFKSILIQDRETHVKQLGMGNSAGVSAEAMAVDLYPLFPAEPFPTFYLRTARGYRFLRTFLAASMGGGFLTSTARLTEAGDRVAATLADEIDQRVSLLYGLYFLSADAVGMARDEGLLAEELAAIDATAATSAARAWLASWTSDADVARDPRVILPIFIDPDFIRYWAVIGVKVVKARAEFVPGHEPVVTATGCWSGKLVPHNYALLSEVSAEIRLPASQPPPTRDELRAICDAHASKDEIVKALGSQ
jgi:hypothetical protein